MKRTACAARTPSHRALTGCLLSGLLFPSPLWLELRNATNSFLLLPPPLVFSLFSPGPALVVWKALGARRSAVALRPRSRWTVLAWTWSQPRELCHFFSAINTPRNADVSKGSSFFFFSQEARQEMLSIRFLQKWRGTVLLCQISRDYCAKYPGILHNLRSHLDFLSDYILSNLAEPSNQHQLHLFNQSKFPLKGGGGRKNTKHSL